MKKRAFFLIFAIFALMLSAPALAVDTGTLEDALPDSAREILGDVTVADVTGGEGLFQRLWQWVKDRLSGQIKEAARSACIAMTVTLLCSVAAAAAAAGQGASGAARYAASALFFDVLMTLGTKVILPLIYSYAAVSAANAALPEGALGGPVKLMSWLCTTLLTALTTVFTLCLSLSGVIAGGADKVAGSLAKTTISAALPVVGKILSDAADTYLAGARILRSVVGIFGLAAVLGVCLGPLIGLGLHYLLFKAAACISEPFSDGRLSALVGNIATAYGMALGLLGSAGLMLFVSAVIGTEALTG